MTKLSGTYTVGSGSDRDYATLALFGADLTARKGSKKMTKLKIIRLPESKDGTFGVLYVDGYPCFLTLELNHDQNKTDISSIPRGIYPVVKHTSPKESIGKCLLLKNTGRRKNVLIHKGNTKKDTTGCILVAKSFYAYHYLGRHGISGSTEALSNLLAMCEDRIELDHGHSCMVLEFC